MENQDKQPNITKEDIKLTIKNIQSYLLTEQPPFLHSLAAINKILRLKDSKELFDKEIKQQLSVLWSQITSAGINLDPPPVLFGLKSDLDNSTEEYKVEGDDEILEIKKTSFSTNDEEKKEHS